MYAFLHYAVLMLYELVSYLCCSHRCYKDMIKFCLCLKYNGEKRDNKITFSASEKYVVGDEDGNKSKEMSIQEKKKAAEVDAPWVRFPCTTCVCFNEYLGQLNPRCCPCCPCCKPTPKIIETSAPTVKKLEFHETQSLKDEINVVIHYKSLLDLKSRTTTLSLRCNAKNSDQVHANERKFISTMSDYRSLIDHQGLTYTSRVAGAASSAMGSRGAVSMLGVDMRFTGLMVMFTGSGSGTAR